MVLVYDTQLPWRGFQVQSLVTHVWMLLCYTIYKILYMCRIPVPAVRSGDYFRCSLLAAVFFDQLHIRGV